MRLQPLVGPFIFGLLEVGIYKARRQIDRVAYQGLIFKFISEYLKPAAESCSLNPIQADIPSEQVVPAFGTDIRGSFGKHTLKAHFEAMLSGDGAGFNAETTVTFSIDDYCDFDPAKGIDLNRFGIGFVPHLWLVQLRDANMAAEFNIHARWGERLTIVGASNTIPIVRPFTWW